MAIEESKVVVEMSLKAVQDDLLQFEVVGEIIKKACKQCGRTNTTKTDK